MKLFLAFFIFIIFSLSLNAQDNIIIGEITIEGNNITKDYIVKRELLFKTGDTLSSEEWQLIVNNSINNIINTRLFHTAEILSAIENNNTNITVKLLERWYIWPIPQVDIDERNFNTWWQSKDLSRASAGLYLTHNNVRGRGEILKVLMLLGYNKTLGLSYEIPYLTKSKTFGIGAQSIYTLKHEVNALTLDDKQGFLKIEGSSIQRDWLSTIQFTYRPKYYLHHLFQIRYHKWEFADTLVDYNPLYTVNNSVDLQYFGLYYKLKLDHRDYKSYPLNGYYIDFEAYKYGLGIMKNNVDFFYMKTTSRKYWNFGSNFYAAAGIIAKKSLGGFQPYLLEHGLGYGRDLVRGYEYYVVDGQDYAVIKANLKYGLLNRKVFNFNFIPSEKFNAIPLSIYVNLFADAGYVGNNQVYSNTNILPNSFLFGSGVGLDFITYYDSVMRIEWAMNKMGESKLFLHFIAPI